MFYPQEVFLSTISDANPLLSVVGRCSVLEVAEYTTQRPTQHAETDVYVSEAVYDESKRSVRGALPDGLKKYLHSPAVQADEIFYFRTPIVLQKVSSHVTSSWDS